MGHEGGGLTMDSEEKERGTKITDWDYGEAYKTIFT